MGNGTASGVQTPVQWGVITREHENFPMIPPKLLKLTPEKLQKEIALFHSAILANDISLFPDLDYQEKQGEQMVIYQFAKTAVERQINITQT